MAYSYALIAPDVQDALAEAIHDAVDGGKETVPVTVGHPLGAMQLEHVWIDGGFAVNLPRRVSGGAQRDETAIITARVLVVRDATDIATVRNRALVIGSYVDAALANDPTLGGVVKEAHVAGVDADEGYDGTARQYGLTYRIAYQATVPRVTTT